MHQDKIFGFCLKISTKTTKYHTGNLHTYQNKQQYLPIDGPNYDSHMCMRFVEVCLADF